VLGFSVSRSNLSVPFFNLSASFFIFLERASCFLGFLKV
jgi:hypothetical protein